MSRKPRTKEQKDIYKNGGRCWYDDGTVWKECNRPWANRCDGNIHNCKKLKYQFMASLSENERKEWIERNESDIS